MRSLALIVLAAAGLAAAPGPAIAAPPWTAPQRISAAHTFIDAPGVVFSGDGTGLAGWSEQDGVGDDTRRALAQATRPPAPAAPFGPPRPAPEWASAARATYAQTRIVTALNDGVNLAAAFSRIGGPDPTPLTVVQGRRIVAPTLAANPRGDVALAWFDDRGIHTDRVQVALRRPGGRFGRPITLATGRIRGVTVAVGARGDVLVAWDARGVVQARLRRPGRRSFGSTDTIRSQDAFFATLRAAVTPNGRAVVAWAAQKLTEGGGPEPGFVQAAVRPAGQARFREAQLLEQVPTTVVVGTASLALEPDGAALLAWSGREGNASLVKVARTDAAARFGTPVAVSPPDDGTLVPLAAVGPGGDAVVAWFGAPDNDSALFASARPAGGAFGPPEVVGGVDERVSAAALAYAPNSGFPTAVWSARVGPDGPGVPIDQITTYAEAATRIAPAP